MAIAQGMALLFLELDCEQGDAENNPERQQAAWECPEMGKVGEGRVVARLLQNPGTIYKQEYKSNKANYVFPVHGVPPVQ